MGELLVSRRRLLLGAAGLAVAAAVPKVCRVSMFVPPPKRVVTGHEGCLGDIRIADPAFWNWITHAQADAIVTGRAAGRSPTIQMVHHVFYARFDSGATVHALVS